MTFVGRDTELQYLQQYYDSQDSHILVAYGQKGVGKTALIKNFAKDKTCIYYMARSCSDREQRYQWAKELRNDKNKEDGDPYPEYEEIFERALQRQNGKKMIFIVDEFHCLIKGEASFFSRLNRFVQKSGAPLMVILCTSASGWVENSMVAKIGGEVTAIAGFLKVRELSLVKMQELYPSYSKDDCIQLYAALGGVPGLWKRTDQELSATDNIIHKMINKYSSLHGEMTVCLTEDLRETAVYNTILSTMAAGYNKLNDIYHHTDFSRAKISVYLKNLMEIDLVEKVGAGTYRISRPHVRFYFRFIYPCQSMLEELTPEQFYREIVEDAYPGFVREAFRKTNIV